MPRVKAAVVQMTSTADVASNLASAESLVREAAADGAKLIVLPECFALLGTDEKQKLGIAESIALQTATQPGPILSACSRWAVEVGAELVLGGFWERGPDPNHVFNSAVHLGLDGMVRAVYRKIHLFDVDLPDGTHLTESATVSPGADAVVSDSCVGTLGLSVCYDVRFPELYRKLVDLGANVLTVPAAFTLTTGKDHWHVLLRARAIEAQSYVLAAAQVGKHSAARSSYGHAVIVDPWGNVLADCGDTVGWASAYIDLERVRSIRRALPALSHRRL